jgi:UDP-glucuronate decarboxylase
MDYLVTGSCGFLGTNLSKLLLSKGHKVIGIDNFITGNRDNLELLKNFENFVFFEDDICSVKQYPDVDYIFNLACPASPVHYSTYSIETMQTCFVGLQNILDFGLRKNIPIFQSSTSEIYGDPTVSPQSEDYNGNVNCFGPRSCYDCGKRVGEALCYEYGKKGAQVHIGRIFNTYGPYMQINDGRVVSEFIMNALQNKNLIIYGDGSSTRSFCYVSDLISAIMKISKSTIYNPINIGNPSEFTLQELAELIIQMTESSSQIVYKPFRQDDPKKRKPDITLATNYLKWRPQVNLNHGLKKTIDYFRKKLEISTVNF